LALVFVASIFRVRELSQASIDKVQLATCVLLVTFLAYFLILKKEAVQSFKT
jgi:hypothetical protein